MLRYTIPLLALAAPHLASASDWAPTAGEAEMIRALSLRDGSPPCAEVEALSPTAVASLEAIVEHVSMPPWVGMRAASCLISGHAVEARPVMEGWVTKPELKGLGILVLGSLDSMPVEVALPLAQKAVTAGPDLADARRRVARSTRPEIAALAVAP